LVRRDRQLVDEERFLRSASVITDYYAVLGVSSEADQSTIWRAFRRRAAQCHPDCGGSHQDMVLVNEAWAILSDPEKRAHYDESRRPATSLAVRQSFERDQAEARNQAERYPRRWAEYESWLNRLAADFASAQYDSMEGVAGMPFPTASNSVSAALLIGAGAFAGASVAIWLIWTMEHRDFWTYAFSAAVVGTGGAWLGYYLHDLIRSGIAPDLSATVRHAAACVNEPADITVACGRCGQRLRFPRLARTLDATCPRCRNRFELPPAM
jgi:hypothetical protein